MLRWKHLVVAAVMVGATSMAGAAYAFGPGNGRAGYWPSNAWSHGGPVTLWIVLLAIGVFWLVQMLANRRRPPVRDTALEELRRQYAGGKIDHEDFILRKTSLTGE